MMAQRKLYSQQDRAHQVDQGRQGIHSDPNHEHKLFKNT